MYVGVNDYDQNNVNFEWGKFGSVSAHVNVSSLFPRGRLKICRA